MGAFHHGIMNAQNEPKSPFPRRPFRFRRCFPLGPPALRPPRRGLRDGSGALRRRAGERLRTGISLAVLLDREPLAGGPRSLVLRLHASPPRVRARLFRRGARSVEHTSELEAQSNI